MELPWMYILSYTWIAYSQNKNIEPYKKLIYEYKNENLLQQYVVMKFVSL